MTAQSAWRARRTPELCIVDFANDFAADWPQRHCLILYAEAGPASGDHDAIVMTGFRGRTKTDCTDGTVNRRHNRQVNRPPPHQTDRPGDAISVGRFPAAWRDTQMQSAAKYCSETLSTAAETMPTDPDAQRGKKKFRHGVAQTDAGSPYSRPRRNNAFSTSTASKTIADIAKHMSRSNSGNGIVLKTGLSAGR